MLRIWAPVTVLIVLFRFSICAAATQQIKGVPHGFGVPVNIFLMWDLSANPPDRAMRRGRAKHSSPRAACGAPSAHDAAARGHV
jgi:hypothetical protein